MAWAPEARLRAEEQFPKFRDRLAIEFDACTATGKAPERMPRSVRRAMRKNVGANTGFGIAELLLLMQALWLLWQMWQRYQASNPAYKALESRVADPVNLAAFLDESAEQVFDELD